MAAMKAMKAMKKSQSLPSLQGVISLPVRSARPRLGTPLQPSRKTRLRIVSKKVSAQAKAKLGPWIAALQQARKALNVKGFAAVKKGTPLYKKAKELYGQ